MKISILITVLSFFFNAHLSNAQISFDNTSTIYLGQMYSPPVTSEITISGYPNETIGSTYNILSTTISIELSHVEAMEIWLECPNGSRAALINLHVGSQWESIPGGYSTTAWSGTFLGDPTLEATIGTPGVGWDYTFSSVINTWGDIETELVNGNFLPATQFGNGGNSMNPNGVYLPYWTFDSLDGCPVDGTWILNIQDNVDFHNGTFFGWNLSMNSNLATPSVAASNSLINVFPNPVQSSIQISVPSDLLNKSYVLINELGTVLIEGKINSLETVLDLSTIETGMYFIRVEEYENTIRVIKL